MGRVAGRASLFDIGAAVPALGAGRGLGFDDLQLEADGAEQKLEASLSEVGRRVRAQATHCAAWERDVHSFLAAKIDDTEPTVHAHDARVKWRYPPMIELETVRRIATDANRQGGNAQVRRFHRNLAE
jgi:hypothetical protein